MPALRMIAVVLTIGLVAGVGLTFAYYLGEDEVTRHWVVGCFFTAVLSTLVATAGLRSRIAQMGSQHGFTVEQVREVARTAPKWTVAVLVVAAAHALVVVVVGAEALGALLSTRRTRIVDADAAVILAMQSIAVLIQAFGTLTAWSAVNTHWSMLDLDDESPEDQAASGDSLGS